jgi:hypothetical protein
MKPKRPTETDLLAIVQTGFQEQLPKDRGPQHPAPAPTRVAPSPAEPAELVPMVRITLAIPEDLRYRLKLAMMDHRRLNRSRITQDEFCAQAITVHLDTVERGRPLPKREDPLVTFLQECLERRGLTKTWAPKAKALLAAPEPGSGPAPTPEGISSGSAT